MEVLINLAGGVALLLWGIRMVRTGVTRAFGAGLRRGLALSTGNRAMAFLAGLGVTAVLQSSTATALIVSAFAGRGLVATAPALAVMLGADVGSTVVVQLLSFGIGWLFPLLIATGVVTFLATEDGKARNIGRTLIGLGLMLLAIRLIVMSSEPLRQSETIAVVLQPLADQPVLALLVAALLTWAAHSSLTVVVLVMSLATMHVIGLPLAFALVLGANVGGAIAPLFATAGQGAPARRVPLGNLLMRSAGALACIWLVPWVQPHLALLGDDPARYVANFHTAFNLALALLFLPLTALVARAVERLLPERAAEEDEGRPRYLEQSALDSPAVALACAGREALRMGDIVERMLIRSIDVFVKDDAKLAKEIESSDDVVDRLHEAIKLYLTRLAREELDEQEGRRSVEILSFTTNLEHVGDIIDKNLMELGAKKIRNRAAFSKEGLEELRSMHARVTANLRLALNVFMSGDVELARRLLEEKIRIRDLERRYSESHYQRIGERRPDSLDTSSLHLDMLRDLKRINSHVTSVAYSILDQAGQLTRSRLVEHADTTAVGQGRVAAPPQRPAQQG